MICRELITDIAGEFLLPEWIEKLRNTDVSRPADRARRPRIGPCVGGVGKFICIGLNYSDHAKEAGMGVAVRAGHLHEGDVVDLWS